MWIGSFISPLYYLWAMWSEVGPWQPSAHWSVTQLAALYRQYRRASLYITSRDLHLVYTISLVIIYRDYLQIMFPYFHYSQLFWTEHFSSHRTVSLFVTYYVSDLHICIYIYIYIYTYITYVVLLSIVHQLGSQSRLYHCLLVNILRKTIQVYDRSCIIIIANSCMVIISIHTNVMHKYCVQYLCITFVCIDSEEHLVAMVEMLFIHRRILMQYYITECELKKLREIINMRYSPATLIWRSFHSCCWICSYWTT